MSKQSIFLLPIVFLHGLLLKCLIFFPYPEIFVYPYLAKNGFLPYKNILDQHFPSLLMMSFNFRDLGITTPESARIYLIGSVILSHIFIYAISQFVIPNAKIRLIPNFMFLIFQPLFDGYTFWIDSFLAPILLASFYFLLRVFKKKDSSALFMAGLFLGLSVFLNR